MKLVNKNVDDIIVSLDYDDSTGDVTIKSERINDFKRTKDKWVIKSSVPFIKYAVKYFKFHIGKMKDLDITNAMVGIQLWSLNIEYISINDYIIYKNDTNSLTYFMSNNVLRTLQNINSYSTYLEDSNTDNKYTIITKTLDDKVIKVYLERNCNQNDNGYDVGVSVTVNKINPDTKSHILIYMSSFIVNCTHDLYNLEPKDQILLNMNEYYIVENIIINENSYDSHKINIIK